MMLLARCIIFLTSVRHQGSGPRIDGKKDDEEDKFDAMKVSSLPVEFYEN